MTDQLTSKEKRFLRYWAEQKKGGLVKYLILYTIAWTLIVLLFPMAISVFTDIFGLYQFYSLPVIAGVLLAMIIALGISWYTWRKNEAKEKLLLRK